MAPCIIRPAHPHWTTPQALYTALDAEFRFTYKPFAHAGREDTIALVLPRWEHCRVFCVPPYEQGIPAWLERARSALLAVYLLPAATDASWFQRDVVPYASEVCFLPGPLAFPNVPRRTLSVPSMVVVFRTVLPEAT